MIKHACVGLCVLGLLAAPACGDDEGSGGSGPSTTGTGGQGGEGGGGQGGEGGSLAGDGSACTADAECAGDFCATEADTGFPRGYCSGVCLLSTGDCAGAGVCIDVGNGDGTGYCYDACGAPADCRDGYDCFDPGLGMQLCLPACTSNDQCPTVGYCDPAQGLCIAPELDCADSADNDSDGLYDCEDDDCTDTCGPLITTACGAAAPAQASNPGDTTMGTNLFAGSCTGHGAAEQVYSFTPGVAGEVGTLTVVLQSATDQGIYIRTACADPATQIACRDTEVGGMDEQLALVVNGGEPLTIFVDAFLPAQAGPYTVDVSFQAAICGDNILVAPEQCDDGNTMPGDGCAADCTPELGFYCLAALDAMPGSNAGDTATGTSFFEGSCTGGDGALERIYRFNPPADGTLSLVLSSATDQGLYVRSDCADGATEIACVDAVIGGTDETLTTAVTANTPVFIFVDGYFAPMQAGPYTLTVTFTP